MNVFADSSTRSPSTWPRRWPPPAPMVFVVCLALGWTAVLWRTKVRANAAHAFAQREASARGAALELQLRQAPIAAEILGVWARQSRGAASNFQEVAMNLLAACPGVATLEWQPGGIIYDMVPRAGNERVIGLNVLQDPAQRSSAYAALSNRVVTVAGPLTLYHGELGIVARAPIFQRGRDGRDAFWGFVAATSRLADALKWARVTELSRQGYDFAFYYPGSARQKAVPVASQGMTSSLRDAVLQPVRVQGIEFCLALKPSIGWVNKTKLGLEAGGVLLVSGLLSLLMKLIGSRRLLTSQIEEANRRNEIGELALENQRQAQQTVGELETQLNAAMNLADNSAQAMQTELEQARAELQQARQTLAQMQARLDATVQAERETTAAIQRQCQQHQTTIANLKSRLDEAALAARQAAETSAAQLDQLTQANQDLKTRCLLAAQAEARVTELSRLLEETRSNPSIPSDPAANHPGEVPVEPVESSSKEFPAKTVKRKKPRRDDQMDLFESPTLVGAAPAESLDNTPVKEVIADRPDLALMEPASSMAASTPATAEDLAGEDSGTGPDSMESKEDKATPARRMPTARSVNPAQLRKVVNMILPLLTDRDPGAKDCLKDNRATFRSAFAPETSAEFEAAIKGGDFGAALEHLKKAAKKYGIAV